MITTKFLPSCMTFFMLQHVTSTAETLPTKTALVWPQPQMCIHVLFKMILNSKHFWTEIALIKSNICLTFNFFRLFFMCSQDMSFKSEEAFKFVFTIFTRPSEVNHVDLSVMSVLTWNFKLLSTNITYAGIACRVVELVLF